MFIDTHCHLNIMASKEPEAPLQEVHFSQIAAIIAQSQAAGVSPLITVGTSLSESRNCIAIAERFQGVKATIGVHPCDLTVSIDEMIVQLETLLTKSRDAVVGIGEIGLDYYHVPHDKELQKKAFIAQLDLAVRHELPVVIHIRNSAAFGPQGESGAGDAGADALKILELYRSTLRGTIHCFSLDKVTAHAVIGWGWYIGIDGPITYPKNTYLRQLVAEVPLSGIVLETDAPFLPPQALRGKGNCPSNIGLIAAAVAQARQEAVDEVRKVTTQNACTLFKLASQDLFS